MAFFAQLEQAARRNNSLLCVGLDPRPEQFPPDVLRQTDPVLAFNMRVIDATRDLACAFKPNYAFYEALGLPGLQALRQTIDYIGPDVPVILDAKRGDIGPTAVAYAQAAFEVWGAGAVTLHPYLGSDSIAPFFAHGDRGVFILCHTSNPGASEMQALACGGEPLYVRVARLAQAWGPADRVGLVVGATYPEALRAIRTVAPGNWFLVPGVGAQGGDVAAAIAAGLRADGLGMVINVSRAIYSAPDPRAAALALRDEINAARQARQQAAHGAAAGALSPTVYPPSLVEELALDLARIGAVRFGQFTLKSGKTSPIYVDLRLLASYPQVLDRAAAAYAAILEGQSWLMGSQAAPLEFERIAAIPYAALPIGTAVALRTGRPLIYTRKEAKSYGTKQAIEGTFQAGERAVVLDDLISTGASKVEAIAPLVAAGLHVRDVVVLIDRESGGREDLARRGYRLHAVLTLRQLLDVLVARGSIDADQRAQVLNWLRDNG